METRGFLGKCAHACTLSMLPCWWLLYFSSISELDLKVWPLLAEKNLTPKKMVVTKKMSARASRTQPPAVA